jgi:hypothetical protein
VEAVRIHGVIGRWYRRCHYEVIKVSQRTVAERCEHLLGRLGRSDA